MLVTIEMAEPTPRGYKAPIRDIAENLCAPNAVTLNVLRSRSSGAAYGRYAPTGEHIFLVQKA